MTRALDVVHTAAFGVGDLQLCGVYLNRGRLVIFMMYTVMASLIWIFKYELIRIFTYDEEVVSHTKTYMIGVLPSIFFVALNDLQKRWLIIMRQVQIPAINNTFTVPVYFISCYVGVVTLDAKMTGLGYGQLVAASISYCGVLLQTYAKKDIKEAVFWPTKETFFGLGR